MLGTLYLVATPIGNLQDITLRALAVLKEVDLIACEDTRHTRKLLNHFEIKAKMVSYHEHNEEQRAAEFTKLLEQGKNIAVVSDAGTPGICDPSFRVVEAARFIGAQVVPIPGAAAFVSAVIASGLPTDSIYFGGFLPSKRSERLKRLAEVQDIPATLIFYEAPHRLAKSLFDCAQVMGERPAAVARELTKLHEEIVTGSLSELSEKYSAGTVKGEIVLVIDRVSSEKINCQISMASSISEVIDRFEAAGHDHKVALKMAAKELGLTRSEAYRRHQLEK